MKEGVETRISEAVKDALTKLGAGEVSFAVEWPADMAHGDYAVNAAMAASKALGKAPREIAEILVPVLNDALGEDASRIEIAGPGFINITLSESAIAAVNAEARLGKEWGTNQGNVGQRVMIEYGNPNPFKEMHIGHLVGAIVGESFARLIESSGATVLRDTFGGDVGPQVAKALWVFLKNGVTDIASAGEIGKAYSQGSTAYEESEAAKAEIDALNVRIYDVVGKQNDTTSLSEDDRALLYLWQKGREVSMQEFAEIFNLLGTHYDYTFFDSDTTEPGLDAVHDAVTKGILEESEGAIIYRGEKKGLHTLVFVTSRGTPTYETKDVGLAILKEMRAPTDRVIILTATEQAGHFKVVLAALEDILPVLAAKTEHAAHGLLQLTTGKMSSRKGNVITARELISELITKASERSSDPVVAEQVAIGALKYMILRSAPGGNIIFDPEKSLSLDGDSGPYLQYALVRARSILEKAREQKEQGEGEREAEKSLVEEKVAEGGPTEAYVLSRMIARFPGVVAKAQALRAPHALTQYLTQLASEWNSFYAKERIIGGEHEAYNLGVVEAFAHTMDRGLWMLGIPAPERM